MTAQEKYEIRMTKRSSKPKIGIVIAMSEEVKRKRRLEIEADQLLASGSINRRIEFRRRTGRN